MRQQQIESRRVATDAAIRRAVCARQPRRVLDLGCGEGWLVRALAAEGIAAVGVDASPALIRAAAEQGGGQFLELSYAEVATAPEPLGGEFDVVVSNFSLLEEEIGSLLAALQRVLTPGGWLLIQTVHPWSGGSGAEPYRSGWREERFRDVGEGFGAAMPWYFRTLGSWVEVLRLAGWQMEEVEEPLHPESGAPLSLLLACRGRGG